MCLDECPIIFDQPIGLHATIGLQYCNLYVFFPEAFYAKKINYKLNIMSVLMFHKVYQPF